MTDVITKQQNVKLNDIQENRYLIILDVIMGNIGCILNPGHGKNSSSGFQFLYTKRQISKNAA